MLKLNVDCLNLIFNELRDKHALYSCLLVNIEWCNIVVPILWKEHLLHGENSPSESEKKLFNTILSCLPPSSKQLLFYNDIKLPSTILLKTPLFNYISFCKFPKAVFINKIITMVYKEGFNTEKSNSNNLLEQEIYKLFVSQCNNIKELCWQTSQPLPLFPGASRCFFQLNSLCIDVNRVNSNALYEMAQICKDLNELTIKKCYRDLPGLISLIDAQRNLKKVYIGPRRYKKGTCKELGKALARKGNSLNHLYLNSICTISPSSLTSLINLRNLSICNDDCYEDTSEEIKYFRQHLAISELPDLEYLYVDGLSCFKELAMLIEKTKGNILDVDIFTIDEKGKNTGTLIKAIAENCPKIQRLETCLKLEDFIYVKSLLLNCRQLNHIWFDSLDWMDCSANIGDDLLNILTEFSPNSLTDIHISEGWEYSIDAFEQFFESCKKRTSCHFSFTSHFKSYVTEDHKIIIRKYIKEGVIEFR